MQISTLVFALLFALSSLIPQYDLSLPPANPLAPTYSGCGGVWDPPIKNEDFELEVIDRVNDIRQANGLPKLKRSTLLTVAGRYHAKDMAVDDYFNHDTYDRQSGSLVWVCAAEKRIKKYYPLYHSIGENIAAGHSTPQQVVQAWMDSPGHRANILREEFTETGVGFFKDNEARYVFYWVQDFAWASGTKQLYIPIAIKP